MISGTQEDWRCHRRVLRLLLLLLALATLLVDSARGGTVAYEWTVEYSLKAPDCLEKLTIAINGVFPGPSIRATAGDTVVVTIHNELPTEGVVIHWHGIRQLGTPWADGSASGSQCPINPRETYTYQFLVDHAGTFFYHGHNGMQRSAGLYGSLVVDPAPGTAVPFEYDGELSVLLNDWWHKSMYEQELGLDSRKFLWVGEPQSLLIEGRGTFNCSSEASGVQGLVGGRVCNNSSPECAPHDMTVDAGKTYRLRLASATSLSALNFVLEGHNLTVVEVSGHFVEPVTVPNLDLYSGETYSVLFTADQDPSRNYWAAINVRGRNNTTPPGLAILNYRPNPPTARPATPAPRSPAWNDFNLSLANARRYRSLAGHAEAPPNGTADRTLIFLNTQNLFNGFRRWSINNVTYVASPTPVLAAIGLNLTGELVPIPPDNPPNLKSYDIRSPPANNNTNAGSGVYTFQLGNVVDIVLQNANTLVPNNSEIHPWHLHGHDFWILGYGSGLFDHDKDYGSLNFVNPPRLFTAPLFPWGWTALRFVADNPGAWPFHCHVEAHFLLGMGTVFVEGVDELAAMKIPSQNLGCGLTKSLIS